MKWCLNKKSRHPAIRIKTNYTQLYPTLIHTNFPLFSNLYSRMSILTSAVRRSSNTKRSEMWIIWVQSIQKRARKRHLMSLDATQKTLVLSLFVSIPSTTRESASSNLMDKWEYASQSSIYSKNACMIQRDSPNSRPWQPLDSVSPKTILQLLLGRTISTDSGGLSKYKKVW